MLFKRSLFNIMRFYSFKANNLAEENFFFCCWGRIGNIFLQFVLNCLFRLMNNLVRLLVARFHNNEISIHALFFKLIFFILSQKEFFKWILFVYFKLLLLWLDLRLRRFDLLSSMFSLLSLNNNSIALLGNRLFFLFFVFGYFRLNSLGLSSIFFRSQICND